MTAHSIERLLTGAAVAALLLAAPLAGPANAQGHMMSVANEAVAARPPAAAPIPPALPDAAPGAFHMAPLATYAEVLRRPLFSPDRRPHEAAQSAAGPQSFTLRGIIVEGTEQYALVEEGSKTRRVSEGQALGGGTVTKITHDQVVLNVNGVDTAVKLFEPKASGKPTPGLSTAGGIPSQMPPGFPKVPNIRPPLSGG